MILSLIYSIQWEDFGSEVLTAEASQQVQTIKYAVSSQDI